MSYIKDSYNPFDTKLSVFIISDLLQQEIQRTFQQCFAKVKHKDPFRNARITPVENHNKGECDALEALKKKERKSKQKKHTRDVKIKLEDAFKNKKIKTMIDLDRKECNNMKSIILKRNTNINVTSCLSMKKL